MMIQKMLEMVVVVYIGNFIRINKIDLKSKSKSIYFVMRKINGFILAFCVTYKTRDGTKICNNLIKGCNGAK